MILLGAMLNLKLKREKSKSNFDLSQAQHLFSSDNFLVNSSNQEQEQQQLENSVFCLKKKLMASLLLQLMMTKKNSSFD